MGCSLESLSLRALKGRVWHLMLWFTWEGGDYLRVGLDDLVGLFQLHDSVMILYSYLFTTAIAFDIFTVLPEEKEPFLLCFDFITWVILKNTCKLWFSFWSMPQQTAFNSALLFCNCISSSWIILLKFSLYYIYLKINKEAILVIFLTVCFVYSIILTMLTFLLGSQTNNTKNALCPLLLCGNVGQGIYLWIVRKLYVGDRFAYTVEAS